MLIKQHLMKINRLKVILAEKEKPINGYGKIRQK